MFGGNGTVMHDQLCEPLESLILGREFLAGTNSCFTSAAPRCIAVLPFHITMGNDGTQQHHERLCPASPFKPSSVTVFIGKIFKVRRSE
jgi:hypothetical protein